MCVSCVGDVDQDEKVVLNVLTKFVGKKDSLPYIYEECKVRKIKDLLNCKSVHVSTQLFLVCKLRLHVALKPVPKTVSIELAWKLPAVNALNHFRNRLANQYANHFQGLV